MSRLPDSSLWLSEDPRLFRSDGRRACESLVSEESLLSQAEIVARNAAISASRAIMKIFPSGSNPHFDEQYALQIFDKEQTFGNNYATAADFISENTLNMHIRSAFPSHDIMTEESDDERKDSRFSWCDDPIDGTINFVNGVELFAVSVCLRLENVPVVSAIAIPPRQELIVARRGKGAFLIGFDGTIKEDLRKSAHKSNLPLRRSPVGRDVGYNNRHVQNDVYDRVENIVGSPPSWYTSVLGASQVPLGKFAAYMMIDPQWWDIAGVALAAMESDCIVSDMNGNPIDWNAKKTTFLVARDHETHKELIEGLHKI